MHARFMMIAAAAMTIGTSASAEPPKSRDVRAAQPASPPAQVVLASAEESRVPVPAAEGATPPVKRPRTARVTTCRCGDPQASDQQ